MFTFFNNFSIKTRIMVNAGVLLALITFCALYALQSMQRIGGELESIANIDMPLTESIMLLTEHELQQTIHFERALRYGMLIGRAQNAKAHFDSEIDAY